MKTASKYMLRPLGTLLLLLPFLTCNKNEHVVPNVYVDFTINVGLTQYIELNTVGGWLYLTGGVSGLYVRRTDINEFVAFDRTCTYDIPRYNQLIVSDSLDFYLVDTICGSLFLCLDGLPHEEGPASRMLRQYRTDFDETSKLLRVYNR